MAVATVRERIERGLDWLKLEAAEETVGALVEYSRMVREWNRRINLISAGDEALFVERHILDSLGPLRAIESRGLRRLVDVGSGAGLPGIPLAVVSGKLDILLLEANRKKSLFLTEVVDILGLDRVRVSRGRLEKLEPGERFDCALARALRWDRRLADALVNIIKPDGYVVIYRSGRQPEPEAPGLFEIVDRLRIELPRAGRRSYVFLRPCST